MDEGKAEKRAHWEAVTERHKWRKAFHVDCVSKEQAIHPAVESKCFNAKMNHLLRKDESKGGKPKQAAWLTDQNSHQRLVASLVADESDEFSTDTEQRAYNIILTTVYGPVGRKGGPPPVVDIAVSPGFMKELAAEKSVRDHFAEESLDPMRTPDERAEAQKETHPLRGILMFRGHQMKWQNRGKGPKISDGVSRDNHHPW